MPATEDNGRPTVLLVDDEPAILASLRRLLRGEPYAIRLASSGEEGLSVLQQEPVHLVVSDHRMPGMDGAAFLGRVRETSPDTVRILLTGYADLQSAMAAINEAGVYRFLTKPWNGEELKRVVREGLERYALVQENRRLLALTQEQNAKLAELNAHLERKVAERTEELRQVFAQLELSYASLEKTFLDAITVLAGLMELRDTFAGSHSRRVAQWALSVGKHLGLPEGELRTLEIAALLHDIGKIGVPDAVLRKPFAVLPPPERELLMQHPIMGQASLQVVDGLREPARLIRSHHERLDGKGYPDGLALQAIPLGARILAAVNDYDGLMHGKLLDAELTAYEAQQFLREARGTRYDPEVVDAFLFHLREVQRRECGRDEIRLSTAELKSGMEISRDLYSSRGILLVPKGERLYERLVEKIRNFEEMDRQVYTVYVYKL